MYGLPARVLLEAIRLGVVELRGPHPEVPELVHVLAHGLRALWEEEGFLSFSREFLASWCMSGVPKEAEQWRKALSFVLSAECCPPDFTRYVFRSTMDFLKNLTGLFLPGNPPAPGPQRKHAEAACESVLFPLIECALRSPALGEDILAEISSILSGEDVAFWRSIATLFPAEPTFTCVRLWTSMMKAVLGNRVAAPVLERWTDTAFLHGAVSRVLSRELSPAGDSLVDLLKALGSYVRDTLLSIFVAVARNPLAPPDILERSYTVVVTFKDEHQYRCTCIMRALATNPATSVPCWIRCTGLRGLTMRRKGWCSSTPTCPASV